MALGTLHAATCYTTQAEAATMLCSSLQGVSSAGAVSCVGVSGVSASVGGSSPVTVTLRTVPTASPSTDAAVTLQLLGCETYGLDYHQPMIAVWVGCAVAILAAKMAYTKIFGAPDTA